ncbi:MAG: RIP metalloprotease RseP [Fibrobacteres bacterium]|nr:RIP metalloprotease RseP [Fibrobacterota bacterium]
MGLLTGLIILSILVVVHEAGHFLIARLFGVRVLAFSVGFGPVLLKKTIGETEYRLSAVPFGGYVKMKGQEDLGLPDSPEADQDDFRNKSIPKRMAIAFAGPLFNFVFAIIILVGLFMYGLKEPVFHPPVVGTVSDTSAGAAAGVLTGDTIISLNGKNVDAWENFLTEAILNPEHPMPLVVGRVDGRKTLTLTPVAVGRERMGITGIYQAESPEKDPPVVGDVFKGTPAEKAGIKKGDTITAINDIAVPTWGFLVEKIKGGDSIVPLKLTIRRAAGDTVTTVVPEFSKERGQKMVGIQKAAHLEFNRYAFGDAVVKAVKRTGNDAMLIGRFLKSLITAKVSAKGMSGAVGIVQISGEVAKVGLSALIIFMAMISVNLAVVNLFPFLIITDGGMIFFLLLEAIRKKPLSEKAQGIIQRIALGIIGTLLIFTTWNDLIRIFGAS